MTPLAYQVTALVQRIVGIDQSAADFSRSMDRHAVATSHSGAEVALVVLGIVVVALTTVMTLVYFIRPREHEEDHIKRKVLRDGR